MTHRYAAALLLAALAGPWLAGCGDDPEAEPSAAAAALPDDLCAEVPDRLRSDWQLEEVEHATGGDDDERTATCRMTGTRDGAPVGLDLRVTSYGDLDGTAAADRMAAALDDGCASLRDEDPALALDRDDLGCQAAIPQDRARETGRGHVRDLSRIVTRDAVLEIEMTHEGLAAPLVQVEVEGLGGSLLTELG